MYDNHNINVSECNDAIMIIILEEEKEHTIIYVHIMS